MKHAVKEIKLQSGVRGLLIDVPGSEVVRSEVWFNSGFRFAPINKFEMPHITEHLLLGGNSEYPDSILFKKEIEKNGAYFNAHTNDFVNTYEWQCAEFEVGRILKLARPQLGKPLINSKDVKTEKSRVREEIDGNISDHYRSLYSMTTKAFTGRPTLKERIKTLDSISAQDMKKYYTDTHTAQNATVFASGKIKGNEGAIRKGFEAIISGLPEGTKMRASSLPKYQLNKPSTEKRPIPQLYYRLHFSTDSTSPEEWAAAALLGDLLNSFLPSSLFGQVWKKGLAYGISAGFGWDHTETAFSVTSNVSPTNAKPLFTLIRDQLLSIKQGRVSQKELREAKDIALGTAKLRYQTPVSLLGFYADDYVLFGEYIDTDEWLNLKRSTSVKAMSEILDKVLSTGEWGLGLLGAVEKAQAEKLYSIAQSLSK